MTAFIRSLCLSALLAAGAAWAQQQSDNSSNPHSTTAKDKQSTGTSSSSTNQQLDRAEQANPHHPQNKDRETTGQTTAMADKDQMSDMDHDAMMKNATPQQMLQKLHMANLHEIEMAKLAEQNGTDKVKSFAQTIERDHQDADQKVQSLAQKKNITLSDTMKAKNPEMQQKMEQAKQRFQGLKGQEFDRAFANRMATEHKRTIAMAQAYKQNCKDQDVCNLIDTLMPKLQQHEQTAMQLRGPTAQGRTPENPVSR